LTQIDPHAMIASQGIEEQRLQDSVKRTRLETVNGTEYKVTEIFEMHMNGEKLVERYRDALNVTQIEYDTEEAYREFVPRDNRQDD